MGNKNQKEQLLKYIDQSRIEDITQFIKRDIAKDIIQTPLARAVWRNDMKLIQLFLDVQMIYYNWLKANPNNGGSLSITPLMWACKRDNQQAVSLLIQSGADINIRPNQGFSALDYAILHGNYRPALFLFEFIQEILDFTSYYHFAKDNDYRYVNYEIMITHLRLKTKYELIPNIFEKPKKQQMLDPVIDPRESWGILYIQIEFKNPPLIEIDELPFDLQPQNRMIGKIKWFTDQKEQILIILQNQSLSNYIPYIIFKNQNNNSQTNQNQNQISFS